ncbi:MAG: NUDIX domain-containing protein [Patescibacteria group bacterium]
MQGVIRTGVCFFCHDGGGKYLISKRSKNCRDEQGRWDPGGGGVKFGEKIEDAVLREILEEYGTEVLDVEFLGFRDVFREQNGVQTHWVTFDFRVKVDSAEVKNMEPHKCDELRWVTIDEVSNYPEPVHSQFPFYLEKYRERFL